MNSRWVARGGRVRGVGEEAGGDDRVDWGARGVSIDSRRGPLMINLLPECGGSTEKMWMMTQIG